jgi:hypothetical protein
LVEMRKERVSSATQASSGHQSSKLSMSMFE